MNDMARRVNIGPHGNPSDIADRAGHRRGNGHGGRVGAVMKFFGWLLLGIFTILIFTMILAIAVLAPGCTRTAYGQTPTPAPDAIVPADVGLPADFVEDVPARSAKSTHFIRGNERRAIVWSAPEFYQSQGGGWRRKRPKFAADGQDWVTIDNDIQVALRKTTKSFVIVDANGDGVRFPLSVAPTRTSETTFTANVGSVVLTYTLIPEGVKASATVPGSLGTRTWSVQYELVGLATANIAPDGTAIIGPFRLPRPIAIGADGRTYGVGSEWSLQAGSRLQVTLDDTALPSGAFPYELDPTVDLVFPNDGSLGGPNPTYLTARGDRSGGFGYLIVGQELSGGNYSVYRSFLQFPTGDALPDNATVTAVILSTYTWGNYTTTDFDIKVVESNWNDGNPPSQTDWDNAITDTPRYLFQHTVDMGTGWYSSSALGANWISLTGTTDYVLVSQRDVDGTAPLNNEFVQMRDHDDSGGLYKPFLTITYEILPTPTRTATSAITATPTSTPIPPPGCCDCAGRNLNNCIAPVLVANTPTCPTLAPAEPACTYVPNAECGPR